MIACEILTKAEQNLRATIFACLIRHHGLQDTSKHNGLNILKKCKRIKPGLYMIGYGTGKIILKLPPF